jgi:hypothetical protein
MSVPKASTRTTVTTTAGAWTQLFATPTADRTGVVISVPDGSANNVYVRIQPLGASAPAGLTAQYSDETVFKPTTRKWVEDARDNVSFWVTGADDAGGVCTVTAWEVMG